MLQRLRQRWRTGAASRILLGCAPAMVAAAALLNAADLPLLLQENTDGDKIPDAYELFFGLNCHNSADASLDYDGDHLSNLQESALLTDPFAPDTDRLR